MDVFSSSVGQSFFCCSFCESFFGAVLTCKSTGFKIRVLECLVAGFNVPLKNSYLGFLYGFSLGIQLEDGIPDIGLHNFHIVRFHAKPGGEEDPKAGLTIKDLFKVSAIIFGSREIGKTECKLRSEEHTSEL